MSWHPGGPVGNPHAGEGFSGRNRGASKGGPSGVQRSSASQLRENEPLFNTYEHLQGLPRGDAALHMLRKVASMVKPIMSKRGWRVQVLAEFLPPEQNLLGLNINKGYKICIRLRYHNNPDLFLPLEEVVDTMLHELSHNVWGDHDSNFHKLWDELRDEHEALVRKGYTGEGFLSEGKRLGGSGNFRAPPPHEMRRQARESAEKRRLQGTLGRGSGQRLGGAPIHHGKDVRQVIADQVTRRNAINKGCGSGRKDAEKLSQDASNNTFKTKAEEDDANNRAIAQALYELMEEDERRKLDGTRTETAGKSGLAWSLEHGLYDVGMTLPATSPAADQLSEEEQFNWAMQASLQGVDAYAVARPLLPDTTTMDLERTVSAPTKPLESESSTTNHNKSSVKRSQPDNMSGASSSGPTPIKHEMINQQDVKMEDEPLIDLTSIAENEADLSADQWACEVCTCINPLQFLACDACGVERPQPAIAEAKRRAKSITKAKPEPTKITRWEPPPPRHQESLGWNCNFCGSFMEHKWWTCSACGQLKASS